MIMNNLKVRIIQSLAATAAVGALVLTGISPAMALTSPDQCGRDYQKLGFSNPGDCVNYYFNPHH
jgi:hypothetical protein